MKYTIEGFNQSAALRFSRTDIVTRKNPRTGEYETKETRVALDCVDLVILRWLVDFWPKMKKTIIDGEQYAWVKYDAVLADMPLLGIKKAMLTLRMQKMADFGILIHKTVREKGVFSYYGFGPEYASLIESDYSQPDDGGNTNELENHPQNIGEPSTKNCRRVLQKTGEQINSSTIDDSSTKDSFSKDSGESRPHGKKKADSLPYSEIIDYLNQKAGKKYRVTKTAKKLISARFGDGYTLDDFKTVIDNKCAEWLGTKYEKYLQPSTLFTDGHFDNYLNERPKRSRNEDYDDFSAYDESVPVRDSAKPKSKPDTSVPDDWDDIPF